MMPNYLNIYVAGIYWNMQISMKQYLEMIYD